MRPMYPEIENYTCQCERNYVVSYLLKVMEMTVIVSIEEYV